MCSSLLLLGTFNDRLHINHFPMFDLQLRRACSPCRSLEVMKRLSKRIDPVVYIMNDSLFFDESIESVIQ